MNKGAEEVNSSAPLLRAWAEGYLPFLVHQLLRMSSRQSLDLIKVPVGQDYGRQIVVLHDGRME